MWPPVLHANTHWRNTYPAYEPDSLTLVVITTHWAIPQSYGLNDAIQTPFQEEPDEKMDH